MYNITFSFLDNELGLKTEVEMFDFPYIPSVGEFIELSDAPDKDGDCDNYYGDVVKVKTTIDYDNGVRNIKHLIELEGYSSEINDLLENKPDYIDTLVTRKDV